MKIVQDSSSEKSTNKIVKRTKFQGPRILSLILSFSTSIRYFASAPGRFFCLWCKEEPCRWASLGRISKFWEAEDNGYLRPGQDRAAGRVAILQKKETFITRSHGLILIRPGIHWICSSLDNWSGNLYSLVLVVLSNSHVQKYNYRIHWWFLVKTSLQASKVFWNYDQPAFTLNWCRS